jgi:ankyrin repeat protein
MMDIPHYTLQMQGQMNVVRVLLAAGAIVDANEKIRRTPMHCALRYKHDDVARLLLDWGAKLANFKLDYHVPEIPDWVNTFIEARSNCRYAAIIEQQ